MGDLNGDGFPDLVCLEGKTFVVYLNDGKGRIRPKPDALRGQDRVRTGPTRPTGAGGS